MCWFSPRHTPRTSLQTSDRVATIGPRGRRVARDRDGEEHRNRHSLCSSVCKRRGTDGSRSVGFQTCNAIQPPRANRSAPDAPHPQSRCSRRSLDTMAEAAQAENIVSRASTPPASRLREGAIGSPEEKARSFQEATRTSSRRTTSSCFACVGGSTTWRARPSCCQSICAPRRSSTSAAPDNEQLKEDLKSNKMVCTGGKDADGRAIIWLRLRFNDPKKSKALDMGRLIATVQLEALKDPEVAARGIIVVNDMTGVKLKNLDPSAVKFIMGTVLPAMPVRVGRICLFNPPWIIGNIIFPIAINFMSKKLRGRIANLTGDFRFAKLHEYVPPAQLAAEHQGTMPFDGEAWAAKMVAGLATEIS